MSLNFIVEFDDDRSAETLGDLRERLGAMEELHKAMAIGVSGTVRVHIKTTKKSPNTGFWGRVAASVTHSFSTEGATVSIPERGAALRYYGGTVSQKPGGPLLTIPTKDVPVRNQTRLAARDMGLLAFLPSRKIKTRGLLVEGEEYTLTRGKNKGKKGTRPKAGGKLLYVLRTSTDHQPDPTVLPTQVELAEAARDGALDYVAPML